MITDLANKRSDIYIIYYIYYLYHDFRKVVDGRRSQHSVLLAPIYEAYLQTVRDLEIGAYFPISSQTGYLVLFSSGSVIQSTLISSIRSSFHTDQLSGHWNPLSNGNNCAAILLLGRPIHLGHFYHSRTGRSLPACFYFLLMSSLDWQERVATRAARSAVGHVFSIYSLDIFYNVLY